MKKLRIALVEYLNTLPFSEGIKMTGLESEAEVHRVIPSECARMFERHEADISLCPVGALDDLPPFKLYGQYCIGAEGPVATVVLLSQKPLDEIKYVRLDDHSRTSNLLLQVLADKWWKKDWEFSTMDDAHVPDAYLMIGDKVFVNQDRFTYRFDLAEAWQALTGMPMVFAVWIATPETEDRYASMIDHAFESGMRAIRTGHVPVTEWQMDYLTRNISYPLDEPKRNAMQLFREWSRSYVADPSIKI